MEASDPSLLFSSEVQYGCTCCGECCHERWRVPLDQTASESLLRRDWSATELANVARGNPQFFVQPAPTLPTAKAFQTTCQGACVFLSSQGRCLAHEHFGAESKGVVCRLFPFLFVEAPEGVYVGYSFCCRPVRKPEELRHAQSILQESVESAYQEARAFFPTIHYQVAPASVFLSEGVEISWASYLALESGLLELLSRGQFATGFNLVAGQVYLTLAALFLREFADDSPDTLHPKVLHYANTMRAQKYERVDCIARRSRARFGVRRYVLAVMFGLHDAGVTARRKHEGRSGPIFISRATLIGAFLKHLARPYPKAPLDEKKFSEAAGRYFRHVIWRKGLVVGKGLYRLGGIHREYSMLLIVYALLEYLSRALTAQLGCEEAIAEALRTVERDFVLHTGRDETGPEEQERDSYELFLGLFDSLVNSKSFAPSMVGLRPAARTSG